ncbi:MAG: integrase arm-type DNA-binding domain-containing protein [Caulobacteraceae bacterium]
MGDIRIHLTDREIARLPVPDEGWYLARDTELKGFFVVVGRRKRTFAVQGDLRGTGARKTIRVNVGDVTEIGTRDARAIAKGYLSLIARGEHPRPDKARGSKAEARPAASSDDLPGAAQTGITLDQAWQRYLNGHMVRKGRSEATIANYRDHVERIFADWRAKPLKDLATDLAAVAARHDAITSERGPYIANGSMRTLRAIYNHALKTNPDLPGRNPVSAIDWNSEERRNTALGVPDLRPWFTQLAVLENPIRREFHLFTLLSGCRPGALKQIKHADIHLDRRVLHIGKPKGGAKKAFDIPLSREMILCLMRAIRFSRLMHAERGSDWVFAADSDTGHLIEQKEDRAILSKWGNDLRQSFRTLAQVAGVSEFDARLLMNHAIPGVNAGYITRHKILEDHLRAQQQAISRVLTAPAMKLASEPGAVRDWLAPGAARRAVRDGRRAGEADALPRETDGDHCELGDEAQEVRLVA